MVQKTEVRKNKSVGKNNIKLGFAHANKEGITLISLVITIIVLLILATVAISIAIDSNGLFARARKAAEDWNTSVSDEERAIENVFEILNEVNVGETVGGGGTEPPSVTQSSANKPVIPEGANFKYVTWTDEDNDGTWDEHLSDDEPEDWYDYEEKRWANIKTTSNDGTNEAYWVWIPRYAYQVPVKPTEENSTQVPPPFKIVFLEGTGNKPLNVADIKEGETIQTADKLGDYSESVVGKWILHPAFTFGEQELSRNMGSKV